MNYDIKRKVRDSEWLILEIYETFIWIFYEIILFTINKYQRNALELQECQLQNQKYTITSIRKHLNERMD